MKKPLIRIFISIVLAIIICELAYLFVAQQVRKHECHMSQKLTEIFENKTPYDILFVGSSKTHTDINPQIIDSICHTNSYNAGVDGISLFEFKMIFDGYLANHPPPKLLVLSFDLHSFTGKKDFFKNVQYFPFVNNEVVDTTLNNNGNNTERIKWFPFLNLTNYSDDQKIIYYLKNQKGITEIQKGEFDYNGYLSNTLETISSKTPEVHFPTTLEFSQNGLNFLQSILEKCRLSNMKVILVYSPEYNSILIKNYTNATQIFKSVKDLAKKYEVPLLRNDSLKLCTNPDLFFNVGHLNRPGAQVYSRILANQINQIISVSNN